MAAEVPPKVYCADIGKQFPFLVSSFRIADESVEEATYRVFKVDDISILVDLKDLCRRFRLEWSFVTRRNFFLMFIVEMFEYIILIISNKVWIIGSSNR